jgi:hypothetical protein
MKSKEEKNEAPVTEAFGTLFDKRDCRAVLVAEPCPTLRKHPRDGM